MKNNLIQEFIQKAKDNPKTAFICPQKTGAKKISFNEFLDDIFLMNSFLKENTRGNNILLFSYPYNYLFFVSIFSCFFLGKNIVIIDSFGDRKKTKLMMQSASLTDILTDNVTKNLGFLLPGKNKKLNVKNFKKQAQKNPLKNRSELIKQITQASKTASITTFTSGTTGVPKKITRDLSFLQSQVNLIFNNMQALHDDLVYGLLPVYTLLAVFMNHTCLVTRKIKLCNKYNVSMMLVPIKKVQKIKQPLKTIKRTFLGGAILYKKEADFILQKLPSSQIVYVYGASEGAVIYKTELKDYAQNLFTFNVKSNGIDVEILNPDSEGVGEIVIKGETVIGENHTHNTGDYGKLQNQKLIIVGRKKYSSSALHFYNYEYDETLRSQNPHLKVAFSFYLNGKIHVAYSGCLKKEPGIIYHHFFRLPYDQKHKTKLDYAKVIKIISASSHPGF